MNLRILTFNTFLRPYLINTNGNDYKQKRLHDIVNAVKDFDIIAIQEAFDTFTHRQHEFICAMHSEGFTHVASSDKPGLCESKLIDGGIVVFSKWPIVASKFYDFGTIGQSDGLSKKGVLYCRIVVQSGNHVIITSQGPTTISTRRFHRIAKYTF